MKNFNETSPIFNIIVFYTKSGNLICWNVFPRAYTKDKRAEEKSQLTHFFLGSMHYSCYVNIAVKYKHFKNKKKTKYIGLLVNFQLRNL